MSNSSQTFFRTFHAYHLKTFHNAPMEEQEVFYGWWSAAQLWVLLSQQKLSVAKGLVKPIQAPGRLCPSSLAHQLTGIRTNFCPSFMPRCWVDQGGRASPCPCPEGSTGLRSPLPVTARSQPEGASRVDGTRQLDLNRLKPLSFCPKRFISKACVSTVPGRPVVTARRGQESMQYQGSKCLRSH